MSSKTYTKGETRMYTIEKEYPEAFISEFGPVVDEASLSFAYLLADAVAATPSSRADGTTITPIFGSPQEWHAPIPWAVVKNIVGDLVWQWYEGHLNDVVVKVSVKLIFFPIRITIKVRDCSVLLRELFGPNTKGTN